MYEADFPSLVEAGAELSMDSELRVVRISKLALEPAIKLARDLVVEVDQHNLLYPPSRQYSDEALPLESCMSQALAKAGYGVEIVFGELRPAERTVAVSVRADNGQFMVSADLRNELEDHPELGGGQMLYQALRAVTAQA